MSRFLHNHFHDTLMLVLFALASALTPIGCGISVQMEKISQVKYECNSTQHDEEYPVVKESLSLRHSPSYVLQQWPPH